MRTLAASQLMAIEFVRHLLRVLFASLVAGLLVYALGAGCRWLWQRRHGQRR